MSGSMVAAVLASLAAGAALLELARWPRVGGPGGKRDRHAFARRRGAVGERAGSVGGRVRQRQRPRWAAVLGTDERLEALLDAAGRTAVPDANALAVRARVGGVLGAVWGGAAGLFVVSPAVALAVAGAGGAAGRALPVVLLRQSARVRARRLRDEGPELLDLLAVALGCGLPIRAALEHAGRWTVGETSAGFARAAAELGRGSAVEPTLARLLREFPSPDLEAAVAILERSRVHGTPASAPLRALASGARHARARRAMEHAARAAPRVQLVSALLLVPAALCVLAASLVAGGVG